MSVINVTGKHLLIIGNGFDLNLGLPTGYSSFLESTDFNNLVLGKNEIGIHLSEKYKKADWIDIEKELKEYTKIVFEGQDFQKFKKDYQQLCDALTEYLSGINFAKIDKGSPAYNLIENMVSKSSIEDFIIVDFNYTPTLKNILYELNVNEEIISSNLVKIHGSISENIIFGIQDRVPESKFFTLIKKSAKKNYPGIDMGKLLTDCKKLSIFGYSLGETDEGYFKTPFTNLYISRRGRGSVDFDLYHYGDDSYDDLIHRLDVLTNKDLSKLKSVANIKSIDISVN